MNRLRLTVSALYLVAQAGLVLAWWGLLLARPGVRAFFMPSQYPEDALLAFWLADLFCVVGGSAVAGIFLLAGRRAEVPLLFTAGALVYGALYCGVLTLMTGEALLAALLMAPAAAITSFLAWRAVASR